ncbi:dTDP-4-dehydrorhamnose 3,5-epimerase [Candidatus Giovannonibacteria bacterium]|nr:dTDP-4-dehydrorhamnose 3,5-epimerase [Candidatus Giovannonibacteria bacterium]
MKIEEGKIKGLFFIQLEPREDERGFFMRVYDKKIFAEHGIDKEWVQENHSLSRIKGTLRGLHFQYPPDTESKLMRVTSGEAFWACVDLRKNSSTFGKIDHTILSAEKKNMVLIPKGCGNGICTLADDVNLHYRVDNYYSPNNEDNIKWNDPDLNIPWPIKEPSVISERDSKAQSFKEFLEKSGGGLDL